jgi:hypothetical protein
MQFWIDFDKENASTHDMLSQSHRRAAVRIFKWQSLSRLQIRLFFFVFKPTDGSALLRFSLLWALGA